MGHNASRNPFRPARLGLDDQAAVDAYKAASIWGAWWQLDESTRRRYFTADERKFLRRYGAKLDELSCQRTNPTNADEHHFVLVCLGQAEPRSSRERLWLYAQLVCRYERSLVRAARTDLVEYENAALRVENRSLRVDLQSSNVSTWNCSASGGWRPASSNRSSPAATSCGFGVQATGGRWTAGEASVRLSDSSGRTGANIADLRFTLTPHRSATELLKFAESVEPLYTAM